MIAAVVLAAGSATRFGGTHKLHASLAREPVVRRAVRAMVDSGAADEVIVVLGREAPLVRAALEGLAVRFVENPAFAEGMAGSLQLGVAAAERAGASAVLVALGDQPTIEPDVMHAVVAEWREGGAAVVAPLYLDGRGHPVLFDARTFADFAAIQGDTGGRQVVERHHEQLRVVRVDRNAPPDIDTPEDHARMAEQIG